MNAVQVWDVKSGKCVRRFDRAHQKGISCLSFSKDGSLLLSGSFDQTLKCVSLPSPFPSISTLLIFIAIGSKIRGDQGDHRTERKIERKIERAEENDDVGEKRTDGETGSTE